MIRLLIIAMVTANLVALASLTCDVVDIGWLGQMRQMVGLGMSREDVFARLGPTSDTGASPWATAVPQYDVYVWRVHRGIVFRRYYVGFDRGGHVRYICIENA